MPANVTVWPKGTVLPDDFIHQDWNKVDYPPLYPACLRRQGKKCDGFLLPMAMDGSVAIVILNDAQNDKIFIQTAAGRWRAAGIPAGLWTCSTVLPHLRAGDVKITEPAPRWKDVTVDGALLTVTPNYDETPSCPDK